MIKFKSLLFMHYKPIVELGYKPPVERFFGKEELGRRQAWYYKTASNETSELLKSMRLAEMRYLTFKSEQDSSLKEIEESRRHLCDILNSNPLECVPKQQRFMPDYNLEFVDVSEMNIMYSPRMWQRGDLKKAFEMGCINGRDLTYSINVGIPAPDVYEKRLVDVAGELRNTLNGLGLKEIKTNRRITWVETKSPFFVDCFKLKHPILERK